MTQRGVQLRQGKETTEIKMEPLAESDKEPVAYMVSRLRQNKPVEGLTAVDINVQVIRIIDLAKESIKTKKTVSF